MAATERPPFYSSPSKAYALLCQPPAVSKNSKQPEQRNAAKAQSILPLSLFPFSFADR